ncbi:hypothetical protein C4D60_Mb08t06640 [Musa balbisiana]|uniref:Uncharacterized protein n=1 Tax=Musa balbisiana TaxID=52838 RepID=A0A4S8K1T6_MUSBA|nr:hypothetical protein C4D60_Mb08t06640 [Musa balbisiana]
MVIICDVILQYTVTVSLYYVIGLAYGSSRTHTPDDSRDIFLFVSAIPPSCVLTLDFLSSARRSRRPSNCSEGQCFSRCLNRTHSSSNDFLLLQALAAIPSYACGIPRKACWLSDPIGDLRTMNTQVGTSKASAHEAKAMMNVNTAVYKEESVRHTKGETNKRGQLALLMHHSLLFNER